MSALTIRPAVECTYDLVSLGEVMLRLDPGEGRIRTARTFRAWEGGGEYNVARGLRKTFGLRSAVVTSVVDNEIGHLIEDLIMQGGVDTRFVRWVPYDGIGRSVRNGLNFTERGFGIRGALGESDRANSAASQLRPGEVDWQEIFGRLGVRWFHTGGIFAALSATTPAVLMEAINAAKEHGTIVSYDLNYRPSLWKSFGGEAQAREVNREIAQYVDVMFGSDASLLVERGGEAGTGIESSRQRIERAVAEFPNFKVVATPVRVAQSATRNDWSALVWSGGQFYASRSYAGLEIMDRVGGGDAFASGLIYGLLTAADLQEAVEYGAAHGALAMTTPGDSAMTTLSEVQKIMRGGGVGVVR